MVKKQVPDWLNSSLWSSPASPPPIESPPPQRQQQQPSTPPRSTLRGEDAANRPSRSSPKSTNYSSESAVERPAIAVPPPAIRTEARRTKAEIRDPLSSNNNNYNYNSDEDNVSSTGSSTTSPSLAAGGSSAEDISRQAQLCQELSRKIINMGEVRKLASQGIPDGAGIRATVWKLLLGYLPCDRSSWPSELAKKRSQYKHFKDDLLMNPSEITRRLEKSTIDESNGKDKGLLSRSEITHGEHPLSLGKNSIWNQFFQDTEIMEQIDRDVKRTHPDLHFFSGDTPFAKSNQEALKDILIVFAKLNPGIRYVQGMNELLAPLYYVFKNDPNEENAAAAEADTFFCFVELLSGFRDHFCQQLDNSVVGIRSTITKLSQLLKEHDEELWRHLDVTTKATESKAAQLHPQQTNSKRSLQGVSSMSGQFIVAAHLHPQQTTKAIRLRCVRSYSVTESNQEKSIRSQECIFHDQEGQFIHVHIPKGIVFKYKNMFKEGQVYGIRNFLCITNFFKYKTSTLRYMIKFKHDTAVKEYKRMKFPKIMFRFKSFECILSKQGIDEKVLFDVIGRIVEVYSPMEKVIGGKQTRLMDFVLEDVSKRQIHCTLWDEHVDQLIPYYNSTVVDPVILIIQLCRAKFMDNGEVHICSSFDATQLFFTHTSKEFVNFKNSFRGDYTPLRCIESASRLAVGFPINGVGSNNQIITSIEDIYKKKELGNYWVAGTITGVESLLDWCYMSCKSNSCKRKLSESGGMMYCVGCKRSWHEGILRYKLVVRVADHTGDAPMLIWDRECASLVGMSAGELKGKYPEGVHVIPNEIAALRGMSMLFQIVMKKEQVDNYYSAFTVLRICRDEVVLTQHCSGLFDRNEGDLVAANGGDWLDFEDNSEDGVVSDDDGSRGLDAMYKEMEKDKIVDLGDSDGASSSEQATLPLKRCLIDEFDCVGGTSIIDDFDCVGGTSKKAKEIVVKLEKM